MKICPICRRDYADDLSYCLEDGTPLHLSAETADLTRRQTEQFEQETVFRPAEARPAAATNSSRFGLAAVVLLLLTGIGVLAAAGIGGYMYYTASGKQPETPIEPPSNSKPIGKSTINNTEPDLPTVNYNINSSRQSAPANQNTKTVNMATPTPEGKTIPRVISGGVLNGKAISLPKPEYPPAARSVRAGGSVTVQVMVDEQGNVVSASAVSGHPLLRSAATAAAKNAKFSPTLLSGTPVKVTGVIIYRMGSDQPAKIDRQERREIRKEELPWARKNR